MLLTIHGPSRAFTLSTSLSTRAVAFLRGPLLLLSLLVASGCAPSLQVHPPAPVEPQKAALDVNPAGLYWWQLRFKLRWPENEQPEFSRHLLIAEQLLLPVILDHEQQMPLWRFHRRAARTPSGHQFSLIFLADPTTAAQLLREVDENPLSGWLLDRQMIERTRLTRRSVEELAQIEDTSDPDWPREMQRSWPYFVMGASQSWLLQVQELSAQQPLQGRVDYQALLAHYRDVDARLNRQWREHGEHAYLHHLNAIFGYQPIQVGEELRTF